MTGEQVMTIGMQEVFAILIVVAIVGFAIFRRLRKKASSSNVCSGCEQGAGKNSNEKPLHFFKK